MGIFDASQRPNVERMRAQQDIEGLKEALEYPKDWKVRKDAALALGGLGDTNVVGSILEVLKDREKEVRRAACLEKSDDTNNTDLKSGKTRANPRSNLRALFV